MTRPRAPRSLRRRGVLLAVIMASAVPATQCLRQDEVECEEAIATLLDCCPAFDRNTLSCTYTDGCGITYPDLTPGESECIFDKSCSELRARGICERVVARGAYANRTGHHGPDTGGDGGTNPKVCQ